ncbi:hypothetical protein HK099_007289 [Clydaea vesicula]|uniref:Uncharacterized protein n=1 Tax=Clydaea vesicula TaxID=447962 RepID=A0AAD5XTR1_9FUNG|nr:hypothetical protein HK099_007289 [Clydaea vesicula]
MRLKMLSGYSILRNDIKTGDNDLIFPGHQSNAMILAEFESVIYTCSYDDTTLIKWNSTDATILYQYKIDAKEIESFNDKLYASVLSPDTREYYISEIDINSNNIVRNYTGQFFERLYDMRFTETSLYSLSNKFVISWNRMTGEQTNRVETAGIIYGLNIVGDNIYISYHDLTFIEKWSLDFTNKETVNNVTPNGTLWTCRQNSTIVFGSRHNYVTVFDTIKGTIKKLDYDLSKIGKPRNVYLQDDILYIEANGYVEQYNINKATTSLSNKNDNKISAGFRLENFKLLFLCIIMLKFLI